MNLTTVTSRAAAALVAAVAGFASYQHIYDVATGAGEHVTVAAVLPLAIDGLILVATAAMLDDKRQQRQPRLSARVALMFGVVATLAANVASAEPTATARMVAAIPAVSFLLAVEVLARTGKPLAPVATPTVPAASPSAGTQADRQPTASRTVTVTATEPSPASIKTTVRQSAKKPSGRRQMTAAEKVTAAVTKLGADASLAALMKEAGVSESSVLRHRPKPAATVNGHDHSKEVTHG